MIQIQIRSIGLDYDKHDKNDGPVIHYDLVSNGKKIGSSMAQIPITMAEECLQSLKNIEKKINEDLSNF